MKKIKFEIKNLNNARFYFGIVMSSVLFFTSCEKAVIVKNSSINEISKIEKSVSISGEDWFKSVVYADGSVTIQIPSLQGLSDMNKQMTSAQLVEFRKSEEEVISRIQEMNPNFFMSFKKAMESKDPLLIVAEIEASKTVVYNAIKEVLSADGYDLDQEMSNYLANQGLQYKPNSLGIVVLITIVVVIALAVNLTYEYTKTQGSGTASSSAIATNSDLTSETLAAQIALIN